MTKKKPVEAEANKALVSVEALLAQIRVVARDARKTAEDLADYLSWLRHRHPEAAKKLDQRRYR